MSTIEIVDEDQNNPTRSSTVEEQMGHVTFRRHRMQSLLNEYGVALPKPTASQRFKRYIKHSIDNLTCLSVLNFVINSIPIVRCIKEYKIRQYLFGDIIAGITVAIMHIPQGISYGVLANLSPSYGLYVSFFPVIIYVFFGTCPHLSLGTFAIISLMIAQALDGIPLESTVVNSFNGSNTSDISPETILTEKAQLATTLAFLVGVIQLILWLLRLGFITTYFTEPFISGFTTGAAVQVFSSQLPAMFGVKNPRDIQGAFALPRFYVRVIGSIFRTINWVTTGITLSSVLLLYIVKKLNQRYKSKIRIMIPIELILVIFGTLISHFGKFNENYEVAVVGPIQRGLPQPRAPSFNRVSNLFVSSISIAAISLCLSIAMAKMFARKHGYKVKSNQELFAYGMSNVVSSFFQCFPNAASLSRSALQEESGGKTVLVGAFSSVIVVIVIVALAPVFKPLPNACLSAIIVVSLKGLLLQVKEFSFYYRISLYEASLWLVTFLVTIIINVDIGLYAGLAVSFLINTVRTQKPRFSVLGRVGNTDFYKNIKIFPTAYQYAKVKILRFDGSLYACNALFFKRKFYELIGIRLEQPPLISFKRSTFDEIEECSYKYVILDCSPFNYIDSVGVKTLIELFNDLKNREIQFYLSECRYDVRCTLEEMNFYEKTNKDIIFVSTQDAVNTVKNELDKMGITMEMVFTWF